MRLCLTTPHLAPWRCCYCCITLPCPALPCAQPSPAPACGPPGFTCSGIGYNGHDPYFLQYPTWFGEAIMRTGTVLVPIFYGSAWTTAQMNIILNFLSGLGGSTWMGITSLYSGEWWLLLFFSQPVVAGERVEGQGRWLATCTSSWVAATIHGPKGTAEGLLADLLRIPAWSPAAEPSLGVSARVQRSNTPWMPGCRA